jgi:hypothetical protein
MNSNKKQKQFNKVVAKDKKNYKNGSNFHLECCLISPSLIKYKRLIESPTFKSLVPILATFTSHIQVKKKNSSTSKTPKTFTIFQ